MWANSRKPHIIGVARNHDCLNKHLTFRRSHKIKLIQENHILLCVARNHDCANKPLTFRKPHIIHSSQEYATLYLHVARICDLISPLSPQLTRICDLISPCCKNMRPYISWPQRLSNISTAHKNMWPIYLLIREIKQDHKITMLRTSPWHIQKTTIYPQPTRICDLISPGPRDYVMWYISTAHKNMRPYISWPQQYISTAHKNMRPYISTISTAHKNMRPYISMLQEYATLYLLAPEIKQDHKDNISTAHKNMWPNISWPQRLCDVIYLHSSQEYVT